MAAVLLITVAFGLLTYALVGGTRANIIIAFALFLFIGITRGWITLWMLVGAGVMAIGGMFWLALRRYNLDVVGDEAFYTFLYLTRDTFSPWKTLRCCCRITTKSIFRGWHRSGVISTCLSWLAVAGSAIDGAQQRQLFHREVLNNHSGLAISPTLLGSLLIMGGAGFIPLGAIAVGLLMKGFDSLPAGREAGNRQRCHFAKLLLWRGVQYDRAGARRAGCLRLARSVLCLIFAACVGLAKLLFWLLARAGLIRARSQFYRALLNLRPDGNTDHGNRSSALYPARHRFTRFRRYGELSSLLLPDGAAARWWRSTPKRC